MTEDEAKTKWCPFARDEPPYRYGLSKTHRDVARPVHDHNRAFCIGSACMAWRWSSYFKDGEPTISATRGFCGLAGGQQ